MLTERRDWEPGAGDWIMMIGRGIDKSARAAYKNIWMILFLALFSSLGLIYFASAVNDLQCFFLSGATCPAGSARLVGVQNDSLGFENSHAQNTSLGTYAYSICCNNTNSSITVNNSCSQASVIRLSNITNAHVETGNNSAYTIPACLSSSWMRISCSYPADSCAGTQYCVMSMASSDGPENTNAHIGNCSTYSQKVCCGLQNSAPTAPILSYPVNGNFSVLERKPNFAWGMSADPESDPISYNMSISCTNCGAVCQNISVSGISGTNNTSPSPLCVDTYYNWSVSACDIYGSCNQSALWNFRIPSIMNLELIVNTTSFGILVNGEQNSTTDGSPPPIVARNTGNVLVNVTINASALFGSVALDTTYYMFSAEDNETGSITTGCSQTTFAAMNSDSKPLFCNMSYEDANDEARLHFNITVPNNEGAGAKSSDVQLGPVSLE